MFNLDPCERPSCNKILQHEWFCSHYKEETTDDSAENTPEHFEISDMLNFNCESKLVHFWLINLMKRSKNDKIVERSQEFKKLDENKDGLLSLNELRNAFDKADIDLTEAQARQILMHLDLSGKGAISITEFLVATTTPCLYAEEGYIKAIFNQLDLNSDGKVTKDDIMRETQLMGYQLTKGDIKQIFRIHDPKNRGFIDYEELRRSILDF